jgi:NAD(P)-dependent dehydrogenase (short-subunit alcohol dehydrogenase family)
MDLRGASALVSGGASGLGAATARRLRDEGAEVVVLDLRGDDVVEGDVRDEGAVRAAVAAAVARGPLRVAVSSAGIAPAGRLLGREGPLALSEFVRAVEVNLVGTFNVMRLAAEAMARSEPDADGQRGVIVNLASAAAFEGQVGQVAYAASKAGVVGMTLPAARDLAGLGIRVVTIAPGAMDTPMMEGFPGAVVERLAAAVPNPRRLGRPEELADLVAHVVANPYLNGEVIRLDGALRLSPR